jgi:hypothetical protein
MPKLESKDGTSPDETTIEEYTTTDSSTNLDGTTVGKTLKPENTCAGYDSKEVSQSSGDEANQGRKTLDGQTAFHMAGKTAIMTTATGQSNAIAASSNASSNYFSPYSTVYDPTGHYGSGKYNNSARLVTSRQEMPWTQNLLRVL